MTRTLPSTRVVLVAVDASPQSLAALETAAKVASRLHAELRGMYVEDIDLLRMAELPFACAIASSGQTHPLTPESMERQLRRHADIARSAVEAAGAHSNIAASFTVVRGTVYREIERAAAGADFVTVGRSGWSARRLGSVARSLVEAGTASLLMVGEGGVRDPLAVVYDGSPAAERALALASALDGSGSRPITVIAMGEQAAEHLQRSEVPVRFDILSGDLEFLLERLQRSGARTVLIPVSAFAKAAGRSVILERRNMSVFLIR